MQSFFATIEHAVQARLDQLPSAEREALKLLSILGRAASVDELSALAARIAENGTLVTEFPPGTPPVSAPFPRRNRLISALSHGVPVVDRRTGGAPEVDATDHGSDFRFRVARRRTGDHLGRTPTPGPDG